VRSNCALQVAPESEPKPPISTPKCRCRPGPERLRRVLHALRRGDQAAHVARQHAAHAQHVVVNLLQHRFGSGVELPLHRAVAAHRAIFHRVELKSRRDGAAVERNRRNLRADVGGAQVLPRLVELVGEQKVDVGKLS